MAREQTQLPLVTPELEHILLDIRARHKEAADTLTAEGGAHFIPDPDGTPGVLGPMQEGHVVNE